MCVSASLGLVACKEKGGCRGRLTVQEAVCNGKHSNPQYIVAFATELGSSTSSNLIGFREVSRESLSLQMKAKLEPELCHALISSDLNDKETQ